MSKKTNKRKKERAKVAVSYADIERAVLLGFAAQGVGLEFDAEGMRGASLIAKARAVEFGAVLDYLSAPEQCGGRG